MSKSTRRSSLVRTHRAYRIDSVWEFLAITGRVIAWVVRRVWMFRTEVGFGLVVLFLWVQVGRVVPGVDLSLLVTALLLAGVLVAVPRVRRFVVGRWWCGFYRRRVLACLCETRKETRNSSGKLPRIVRSRRTPVGARLVLWCLPGHSAERLTSQTDELRAACNAREVRIIRHRRFGALVSMDIVRDDLLTTAKTVDSPLREMPRGVDVPDDLPAAPARVDHREKQASAAPAASAGPAVLGAGGEDVSDYV